MKQSIRKAKTNQLNKFKQRINKRFGGLLGLYFVTVQKHDEYLNIDIDDIQRLKSEIQDLKAFLVKYCKKYSSYCFGLHVFNYRNENQKHYEDRSSYFPHIHGIVYLDGNPENLGNDFIGDYRVHVEGLRDLTNALNYITKQHKVIPTMNLRTYWASLD